MSVEPTKKKAETGPFRGKKLKGKNCWKNKVTLERSESLETNS